jgi:outer membrane protein TolC
MNYKSFKAGYLPQLSLTGSVPGYNRSIIPVYDTLGVRSFVPQSSLSSQAGISLDQKIPITGGSFNIFSGLTRYDELLKNDQFSYTTTPLLITYNQPLFQTNSMSWDNDIQDLQQSYSLQKYYEDVEDLSMQVTMAFFDLYISKMNLENNEFNVAVNDTLYTLSKGRYEVGKIAENDLLQSELGLMNARNMLESGRLDYLRAIDQLKLLIGLEQTVQITIQPPSQIINMTIDADIALAQAKQNRSDYIGYKITELNAERSVEEAKSRNRFNANMNASYGFNKNANMLPDAYAKLLYQEGLNISFSVPVFQWGKGTAEVEAAIANQKSVESNISMQKQNFEFDIKYQTLQFRQLQQQVILAAKADTIGVRRFDVAKNRYVIGKIDLNTFFIAQSEKDAARTSYIQTLRSFWVAYYRLRRLTLYDFATNKPIVHEVKVGIEN